jgi:hypothetical protein
LQYFKQGRVAYGVGLENFHELRNTQPDIVEKFNGLVQIEDNFKTGGKFRYMFEQDLKEFRDYLAQKSIYVSFSAIRIIDYKYMRVNDYSRYSPFYIDENGENKVKEDIHKQLVYEWAVQQNWSSKTRSEFWIPFFSNAPSMFEQVEEINNPHFNKSQIKVV